MSNKRNATSSHQAGSAQQGGGPSRWGLLLIGLGLAAATALAYCNTFRAPFTFDDEVSIQQNPYIRHLWPIWDVGNAPPQASTAGRPVLSFSLALSYKLSGGEVWGYHLVNLAVHIAAGLALFGVIGRTLLLPRLAQRFGRRATALAAVCAMIWLAHPLQTQAVTYVIQRAESLMGLFYLLTLYCVIRGATLPAASRRSRWWHVAAVAACALGMGTKEVMATAPLVVLLYDRIFLAGSWREVLRRRWWLHVALWASLGILVALMLPGPRNETTGFGLTTSPLTYALTECNVIVQCYLRLAFWPYPQAIDYGWPPIARWTEAAACGLVVLALLAATAWALWRRPAAGFLGAWFFLILAPTSSFVPIQDPAFEHRMYLSLAAIVCLVVLGCYRLGAWALRRRPAGAPHRAAPVLAAAAASLAIGALALATLHRNADYRDTLSLWRQCAQARPLNHRAHSNVGVALAMEGRVKDALPWFQKAWELSPGLAQTQLKYALALSKLGRLAEGMEHYRAALRIRPDWPEALNQTAWLLATADDASLRSGAEAVQLARRACKGTGFGNPGYMDTLAAAFAEAGQFDQAVAAEESAIKLAAGGAPSLLPALRARLELFRSGQAYHASPQSQPVSN